MDLAQRVQGASPKGGDGSSNMVLELPDDADRALEAISNKLGVKASVEHTVNELIATATDSRNLGNIFCG